MWLYMLDFSCMNREYLKSKVLKNNNSYFCIKFSFISERLCGLNNKLIVEMVTKISSIHKRIIVITNIA